VKIFWKRAKKQKKIGQITRHAIIKHNTYKLTT
jgi:hypothetical protein